MTFNTSSLGSAKTFPGGRKDFKDFQELRHLVIEEQRIVDSLEELEKVDTVNVPAEGLHGTYDKLSEINMGDDDESGTWYNPEEVLPTAGSEV